MTYFKKLCKLCSVERCFKKPVGRGLCMKHYQRFMKHGSVDVGKNHYRNDEVRFISYVNKVESGCWEWLGHLSQDGYGQMGIRNWYGKKYANVNAHRVSYLFFKGDLIKGMHIDHLCFNKKCVNPDHLEQVTISINNYRRHARMRDLKEMI